MHSRVNFEHGSRGFSLIEVLVTTVVLGIGILGVSGMHIASKRASFESVQRSTAAELAYALLEDMRANAAALDVYAAAGPLGRGSLGANPPSPSCAASASPCTAAQLAAYNLWQWEQVLDGGMEQSNGAATGGLLSPTACITAPAGGGAGDYVVTVVWRGGAELADAGANDCGAASGLYGENNELRRLVVIASYIDPSI